MINNERPKLKVKALLRWRVTFESNTESGQGHRIDAPADSDAYMQLEASIEKKEEEDTNSGGFWYPHGAHERNP